MKSDRLNAMIKLIESRPIETQEELARALRESGFEVTQATVCRDIKRLALIKVPTPEHGYRYSLPEKTDGDTMSARFTNVLSEAILSVQSAYNQIVIKTRPASADIVTEMIDRFGWREVLGSIAGENTILLIIRSIEEVPAVLERIDLLRKNKDTERR